MDVKTAEFRCATLLHELDALEATLVTLPPSAAKFCFESQKLAKELRWVARTETVSSLTKEQEQDLLRCQNQVSAWLKKAHQ